MRIRLLIIITLGILIGLYLFPPYRLIAFLKPKQTVPSILKLYKKEVFERLGQSHTLDNENSLQIALLAFKKERMLELYSKNKDSLKWRLIKTYPFTAFSGSLGPKLREGDRQIPEGLYRIESLNPNSSYHLSLRLNYPNDYDILKAEIDNRQNLGGDIMIHGKDVTIGCIPIGDKQIEEVFVLAALCFQNEIPIIISPMDFRVRDSVIDIDDVKWEKDLYLKIKEELNKFKIK